MIFNDFDIWEQAFKDMKLNESVSFVSRGRLITEASQVEMFNKINALLNCDRMECSHKWLYSIDPTELSESEATRVNNLYKLGCERGLIDCGEDGKEKEANEDEVAVAVEPAPIAPAPAPVQAAPTTAYTVLYSAMRNGEIKTGEAYSNSINPRSAKADVIGQLERAGYANVKVLAIECGDPDERGNDCCNTYCPQADMTPVAPQVDAIPDYAADAAAEPIAFEDDDSEDDVSEADDKDNNEEQTDEPAEKDGKKDKDEDPEADSEEDEEPVKDDKEEKKEDAKEPDEKLKDDADEKAEKASDKEKDDKELDASEKSALKDSYKKAFKATMQKCKFFDKSFDDLTLEEKVAFFTELSKAWGSKADPSKFMTDKELQQLQSIVIKK